MTVERLHPKKPIRSRILFWVIVLTLLLLAPSIWLLGEEAAAPLHGRWILDFQDGGRVELTLKRSDRGRGHWKSSDDFEVRDFQGLQRPSGKDRTPAHFELRRDAGTLSFDGELDQAGGAGRFAFAPGAEYAAALAGMGYARPDAEEAFSLAVHDVSRDYIRELAELGYRRLSLDDLVAMRIQSATPAFIRAMKALGYDRLSADDLVAMRIHDATPEFVKAMRDLGYSNLSADDLVSMKIHGVTPEFVRGLQELGYRGVPADDLVSMRIHGES
jgi:hypothetical protein